MMNQAMKGQNNMNIMNLVNLFFSAKWIDIISYDKMLKGYVYSSKADNAIYITPRPLRLSQVAIDLIYLTIVFCSLYMQ